MTARQLSEWVREARERTLDLVADLSDEQLMNPCLPVVNPLGWEIGHVAWFQEKWVLREVGGHEPIRDDADALWDSIAIPHGARWELPLPSREETLAYLGDVRDRVLEALERGAPTPELAYHVQYTVFHEDMHTESFTHTRQTLGFPAPARRVATGGEDPVAGRAVAGDAEIAGGTYRLGAERDTPFVFDNEKWAHPVRVEPFAIAKLAVTQGEFRDFVEDAGYRRDELWDDAGRRWREDAAAGQPVYWRRDGDGWERRDFDRWVALEPARPMVHVNVHEARAYCRWAARRLPTEAEWELAAGGYDKRTFPWGSAPPTPERAHLDWHTLGAIDVGSLPAGDSPYDCRQMIGNVWEWTDTTFGPFPGFEVDPYVEYSEPWFGDRNVLRGGCFTTRGRMLRNTWRNYQTPDRRDLYTGFRTCALR